MIYQQQIVRSYFFGAPCRCGGKFLNSRSIVRYILVTVLRRAVF